MIFNLNFIRKHGTKKFINNQQKRIRLLEMMLNDFNDGRSKSFYCIASTLLPIACLEEALDKMKQKIKTDKPQEVNIKTKTSQGITQ